MKREEKPIKIMCLGCNARKTKPTDNRARKRKSNEKQKREKRERFSMKNKRTIKCHYKTTVVTKKKLVTGCTAHDKREIKTTTTTTPSPRQRKKNEKKNNNGFAHGSTPVIEKRRRTKQLD